MIILAIYPFNMKNILGWVLILAVTGGVVWYAFFRAPQSSLLSIGVSQISTDAAFDQIKAGMVMGFKSAGYEQNKNVLFAFENAGGSNNANLAIAQKFANGHYDLLIPLGTPATRAVVDAITDRPIVFGAVADPEASGVVSGTGQTHANVTGVSDAPLYLEHLALLSRLAPKAKTVTILYQEADPESSSMLSALKPLSVELGVTFVYTPVRSSNELLAVAGTVIDKTDALYVLPSSEPAVDEKPLLQLAIDRKKPMIVLDKKNVALGGLANTTVNYQALGERVAEIAVRILRGEDIANIPVEKFSDSDLFINAATAEKIGLVIPADVLRQAKQVYR